MDQNQKLLLIHTRELKLWHFPICLHREAIRLQRFPPTRMYKCDELYPICSKLQLLYGFTVHVALYPGATPSSAVLR